MEVGRFFSLPHMSASESDDTSPVRDLWRGGNEMDGLSSYYRTEEGTIHCLPAFVLIEFLPSACLSFFVSGGMASNRQVVNVTVTYSK